MLLSTVDENEVEPFLRSVAQSQNSALLLDYDGTLAPFSIDRKRALPYAGVTTLLQELVDTGRTRVVIISGRNAYEVGPLLGVKPCPEIWGSHGLQRLLPDGTCEMPEIDQDAIEAGGDRDIEGRDRDLAADVRDREAELRDREAEALLKGEPATRDTFARAADAILRGARGFAHNAFKIELARRTILRALSQAAQATPQSQSDKRIAGPTTAENRSGRPQ